MSLEVSEFRAKFQAVVSLRTVTAQEAHRLLEQGYAYLDVRSEIEFEQGHVPHAFNIPLMHPHHDELVPNLDFLAVALTCFTSDAHLIVGCHAQSRARRACDTLVAAGFCNVTQLSTGWEGCRDAFGRLKPGWSQLPLPAETGTGDERGYAVLRKRAFPETPHEPSRG